MKLDVQPQASSGPGSWDPVWEQIFASQSRGKYPPEELIRFIARNYDKAPDRKKISILEVGCGPGACVWYLAREGFSVTGIDGSPSDLRQAGELLKKDQLSAELLAGDVLHLADLMGGRKFDAIIDVACIQHNRAAQVARLIDLIHDHLVPGGRFFSIAIAAESEGYGLGREIEKGTFVDIPSGPLKGKGTPHFFTIEELQSLLKRFASVEINFSQRSLEHGKAIYKEWICCGVKPS